MTPALISIVGKGRSGSTLIDRVLGSSPDATSVGELWLACRFATRDGFLCGCGAPIAQCPVWAPVLGVARELAGDVSTMQRMIDESVAWRRSWLPLVGHRAQRVEMVAEFLSESVNRIADTCGVRAIVESSLWPLLPTALGRVQQRVVVIHLVRDPRAVAYSWSRPKPRLDRPRSTMARQSTAQSSASYLARHVAAELARRRSRASWFQLRYEDFCESPAECLSPIAERAGIDLDPVFAGPRTVHLGPHHIVGGNPGKHRIGPVPIEADTRWHRELSARARVATTLATYPLLRRYGYPVSLSPRSAR